jgi:hypothetical protein
MQIIYTTSCTITATGVSAIFPTQFRFAGAMIYRPLADCVWRLWATAYRYPNLRRDEKKIATRTPAEIGIIT